MTSVCFDALPDHSRQCEYAFTRTVRANNSRQCETALTHPNSKYQNGDITHITFAYKCQCSAQQCNLFSIFAVCDV